MTHSSDLHAGVPCWDTMPGGTVCVRGGAHMCLSALQSSQLQPGLVPVPYPVLSH